VNRAVVRERLLRIVGGVAPEADLSTLRPDRPLREQLDLDSFDLLTVLIRVRAEFGVDVPEADYGRLRTVDDTVAYLAARLGLPG